MSDRLRRFAAALLTAALLTTLSGCGAPTRHSRTWYTFFDTVTTVTGYGSEKEFNAACDLAEAVFEKYHMLCDIYHEYGGMNNARTVNLSAGIAPVETDAGLRELLRFGKEVYDLTGGTCNVAMGAVLSLWHDCREEALNGGEARLPDDASLRAAAEHCDIADLVIDEAAGTVFLADPYASLDLGAVAKGWAAEQAARALEAAGYTGYAFSVGGNVRTVGTKPGGEAWVAGVRDPNAESESAYLLRLSLADASLVTSGSYQRYYEVDGVLYHHIISPDTLCSKNEYLSVSILCRDSALADALSTAVFNMEPEAGLNYVNQMDGVEACWILADGTLRYSDGFEAFILQ